MARLIRSRPLLVVVAVLLGGYLGYSIVGASAAEQQARSTAGRLAQPLAAVCATVPGAAARAGERACETAKQTAAAIPVPVPGRDGRDGARGIGVASTEIRSDGHLLVIYDDGRQVDAGPVVGPAGAGLAAAVLTDGHLVLTYSDGRTQDLGPVVGDTGRGIASVAQVDGRLLVTYDDGTTSDAGPLPAGPAGVPGPPGGACRDGYAAVDGGAVTAADGRRYERSTVCVDPTSEVQR